ncbi:MAG: sensor histidine kinase, partial [Longimicrobiales bacterium]
GGRAIGGGRAPRTWPVAVGLILVGILAFTLAQRVIQSLRDDAEAFSRVYQEVQAGLTSPDAGAELAALTRLQRLILDLEVPMVVTGPDGEITAYENLPFQVSVPPTEDDLLRMRSLADGWDEPVGDPGVQLIYYGMTPDARLIPGITFLIASGLLLTVVLVIAAFRFQRRAAAEQAWTAMARELAHQLGTPISSLQGWVQVLELPPGERPGDMPEAEIASAIEEDLVRLERVSRRFELIGREPELERVSLRSVVAELRGYLEARLPRLGPGVALHVDVPEDLPSVQGHEVLLAWALENVVKNALDAVAGTGGSITISARPSEGRWVTLKIKDTGPGVPQEIRDRLFDPGITTKSGGWGVGLTLTRRIIEGVHGGRIELLDRRERGATFQVRLPRATEG